MSITENALLKRINRKLSHDLQQLHRSRILASGWPSHELGGFYLRDANLNTIIATHVDIEDLANELGVLRSGERLDENPVG
ncbi:MAG: hypothetical protein ACK5JE_11800 [Castellaniella sp.]|uniref:hypothetical protein n=1 Tax=Castellaniella sp. TaxID=1955812 RepID=UPI003A89178E